MLLRELEPELYWSFPSTYDKKKKQEEIKQMIISGDYYFQLKTDGNYSSFVCDFDGEKHIITRGVSKVTGTYGRVEDKLFFFDAVAAAFNKPTRIMAEIWYDGGIDRNVGSVLRAGAEKSKSIQSKDYYAEASKNIKFTAKDKRDIENNDFFDKKLRWRIFDIWYFDGEDLTHTPWIERQKYVKMAAERINHPLVTYVKYYPMDNHFYDNLATIFSCGGEGVVCYRNNGLPEPGKRTAHKTLKVKRELENLIDCFIIGVVPAIRNYTGKDIDEWQFWEDTRTGEKKCGSYYKNYLNKESVSPITKGYYYNWPGAIKVGVYADNSEIIELCKVAGLSEDFKTELRDNYDEWHMCPVTIGGMAISTASSSLSIRHPYLKSIRKDDLNLKDCTLSKILSQ